MGPQQPTKTGDQVLASAMRTAINRSDIGVLLWRDGFEITGPYDTHIAMILGRFPTPADLAAYLGIPESDIDQGR
ncbi:hypothetical protein ACFWIZ_46630 [Streptomyces sp. NPDC127044]